MWTTQGHLRKWESKGKTETPAERERWGWAERGKQRGREGGRDRERQRQIDRERHVTDNMQRKSIVTHRISGISWFPNGVSYHVDCHNSNLINQNHLLYGSDTHSQPHRPNSTQTQMDYGERKKEKKAQHSLTVLAHIQVNVCIQIGPEEYDKINVAVARLRLSMTLVASDCAKHLSNWCDGQTIIITGQIHCHL